MGREVMLAAFALAKIISFSLMPTFLSMCLPFYQLGWY